LELIWTSMEGPILYARLFFPVYNFPSCLRYKFFFRQLVEKLVMLVLLSSGKLSRRESLTARREKQFMAAYVIALVSVKDSAKLQEYSASAGPTVVSAGGTVAIRGKVVETLVGTLKPQACLVLKFETAAAARAWYQSPEYQRLIPVRDEALTPEFVVIEE
jgi:uncharacterized protein (DUF1330 family)